MQCWALGPCRATDDTVQLSGAVKSWPGWAGSTIVLPSVFPARDTSMASRCSPSSSTTVSWRWCGRQLSGCRRRPPWGTGGAGATRVAASLSATMKRRPRPSAAALIAERASRNAVVNIGRTQPELRRTLARRPRLVPSPRLVELDVPLDKACPRIRRRRRRRRGDRPLGRRSVRVMRLPAAERELSHSPRISTADAQSG